MNEFTVFLKIDGKLEAAKVKAKTQKEAKKIAGIMFPKATIGYARLVS